MIATVSLKTQKKPVFRKLLTWYDQSRRDLPWRMAPGEHADPYRVWLSEIMLQQTTVKAVIPYFFKFLSLWPKVEDLARADLNDILKAWAGLGYYSRARNLHACASEVVENFAGKFPDDEKQLLSLPGIGPYTAAAIASIAFGKRAVVVDGNVERVVARLFAVQDPLPSVKPKLKQLAGELTPSERPGDYAQAMMDLGATICSPKKPSCLICPLKKMCAAHALGNETELPRRERKAERPTRQCVAFVALREDGKVLVRERPAKGLLGGMTEIPSTEWILQDQSVQDTDQSHNKKLDKKAILAQAPLSGDWQLVDGLVSHVFTHFRLEIKVYHAIISKKATIKAYAFPEKCRWVDRAVLDQEALPSVMRKIIAHGLKLTQQIS